MNPRNDDVDQPHGVQARDEDYRTLEETDLGFDTGRLCNAIQRARLALRWPREHRVAAVRQYVGNHWSEEGNSKLVPCNLLALYVSIVGRKLVANDPRIMLSTDQKKIRPVVDAMESWINREFVKLDLAGTMKRSVIDSLFSLGIVKVALATPADAAAHNWDIAAGRPFAMPVDLDDFVYDHHARDFSQAGFVGHRYRVPLRTVRGMRGYANSSNNLTASEDRLFNFEGDERVSVLGRTYYGDNIEFEDMVDLWEIYLPRHKLIVTLRDDSLSGAGEETYSLNPLFGRALRVQRWLGPPEGPYHFLCMMPVPGNAMPKAPIHDLIDLHEASNRMIRKLVRQCDRMKEVTMAAHGHTEDAQRVMNASDGEICPVTDPQMIVRMDFGGPQDALFRTFSAFKDLYDFVAGGLSLMGGLGPQSKTLGQDKMLNENASATLSDMQAQVVKFAAGVGKAMCWYYHHDPQKVMRTKLSVPGAPQFSVDRTVMPAGMRGPMSRDFDFDILDVAFDPYSLQHQTPQERFSTLNQIFTQALGPMAQVFQSQGIVPDAHAYLQKAAKYLNQPDLPDLLTYQANTDAQSPPVPEAPKPGQTTRNYVRRSVGGNTPQQRQANVSNAGARQMGLGSTRKNGSTPRFVGQ